MTTPLTALMAERHVWIFDLDNTLYPAQCNLFAQIEEKMGFYVQRALGVPLVEAKKIQKDYFRRYGTTLNGLMQVNGIDPYDYLRFVHDIDRTGLRPCPRLDAVLDRLAGQKIIYTNGARDHAEKTLDCLGLSRHFSDIFDIADADFIPKPKPENYHRMIEKLGVDPKKSVFFEDTAQNLAPAHQLGMATVWIENDLDWAAAGARVETTDALCDHIHFSTRDLTLWLEQLTHEYALTGPPPSRILR